MGSLYQSVEVEKLEEPGGQTRNCGDPPSDSHLITSFVCPFKGAQSSGVIRRRPLTCVFTSGQGAAEKERGSAGQVVEDFTEHLPAEKTTGGGRRSSLPLPAATTGAASYLLVPGAPRCSQGSSTRGRAPRQTWLRDQHGDGNVGEELAAVLVPALLPVNIRDGSWQRLLRFCCSLPPSSL